MKRLILTIVGVVMLAFFLGCEKEPIIMTPMRRMYTESMTLHEFSLDSIANANPANVKAAQKAKAKAAKNSGRRTNASKSKSSGSTSSPSNGSARVSVRRQRH